MVVASWSVAGAIMSIKLQLDAAVSPSAVRPRTLRSLDELILTLGRVNADSAGGEIEEAFFLKPCRGKFARRSNKP